MPLGCRMDKLALTFLGAEKEADHGFFIFPDRPLSMLFD
jgi:hypothetical protein